LRSLDQRLVSQVELVFRDVMVVIQANKGMANFAADLFNRASLQDSTDLFLVLAAVIFLRIICSRQQASYHQPYHQKAQPTKERGWISAVAGN
jgi:hypothetical protein